MQLLAIDIQSFDKERELEWEKVKTDRGSEKEVRLVSETTNCFRCQCVNEFASAVRRHPNRAVLSSRRLSHSLNCNSFLISHVECLAWRIRDGNYSFLLELHSEAFDGRPGNLLRFMRTASNEMRSESCGMKHEMCLLTCWSISWIASGEGENHVDQHSFSKIRLSSPKSLPNHCHSCETADLWSKKKNNAEGDNKKASRTATDWSLVCSINHIQFVMCTAAHCTFPPFVASFSLLWLRMYLRRCVVIVSNRVASPFYMGILRTERAPKVRCERRKTKIIEKRHNTTPERVLQHSNTPPHSRTKTKTRKSIFGTITTHRLWHYPFLSACFRYCSARSPYRPLWLRRSFVQHSHFT